MEGQMQRTHFGEGLERLRGEMLAMGALVEQQIRKARTALESQDPALAREVKEGDAAVDEAQGRLQDEVAMLIATQQPVAQDMRELLSAFGVADELERIGDHAVHVAKAVIKLAGGPYPRAFARATGMADIAAGMVRDAVAAFAAKDAARARAVAESDDRIDALKKELLGELFSSSCEAGADMEQAAKVYASIAGIERMGDHVTNVCEAVVYVAEGRHAELD